MKEEYWPEDNGALFQKLSSHKNRSRIIKNQAVKVGAPAVIVPSQAENNGSDNGHGMENILPLKNNGEVVGFEYHCQCGESVKILFEFDDQV